MLVKVDRYLCGKKNEGGKSARERMSRVGCSRCRVEKDILKEAPVSVYGSYILKPEAYTPDWIDRQLPCI